VDQRTEEDRSCFEEASVCPKSTHGRFSNEQHHSVDYAFPQLAPRQLFTPSPARLHAGTWCLERRVPVLTKALTNCNSLWTLSLSQVGWQLGSEGYMLRRAREQVSGSTCVGCPHPTRRPPEASFTATMLFTPLPVFVLQPVTPVTV